MHLRLLKKIGFIRLPTHPFHLSLLVSFDVEALGGKAADTATPAEAINYFCEIRMEEELERARLRTREKTPVQVQDNSRNTVLVLPKIHR